MFDFPDSPTNGQQTTTPDGVVYVWDGVKWHTGTAPINFVRRTGDVMTGPLVLSGDPTLASQAASKGYADQKLALTGGTMTGPIVLPGDPTTAFHATTKAYVDGRSGVTSFNTRTGAISLTQADVTGVGFITSATSDSRYVDVTGDTMTGNLRINADLIGDNGVYAGYTASGGGLVLHATGAERYLRFAADGWRLSWATANGTLHYYNNAGALLWQCDGGGNEYSSASMTSGYFHSTGPADIDGRLTTHDAIMNWSGVFYVANNTGYYLARNANDGHWRFVDGGTENFRVETNGNIVPRGGVYAQYLYSYGDIRAAGTLWSDATGRIISKRSGGNPSVVVWDTQQGWAAGMFMGGGQNLYFSNMDGAGNWSNPIYGWFSHPSGDFHANGSIYSQYDVSAARDLHGSHVFCHNTSGSAWSWWYDGNSAWLYQRMDSTYDIGIGQYSSIRAKQDVADTKLDCLSLVRRLPLREFRFLPDGPLVPIGFISEEVEKIIPEASLKTDKGYAGVDTNVLLALLAGAVREMSTELFEIKKERR